MPLKEVQFEIADAVSARVQAIIAAAEDRIETFVRPRNDGALTGFVPADYVLVARALHSLRQGTLLLGDVFVEWGSGLGAATMVAAELGYHAHGIEILHELVDEAEALAEELDLDCEFSAGTCVPHEAQDCIEIDEAGSWIDGGGQDGHALLGLEPEDADLVYAYPWPGEAHLFEALFERIANEGALFLTYNGIEGLRLLRKY